MPLSKTKPPSVLLFTFNVFPDLLIPSPDIIWPAPENWVKLIEVVPKEIVSVFVHTNPKLAWIVPFSTNVKAPLISVLLSKSLVLVQLPPSIHM